MNLSQKTQQSEALSREPNRNCKHCWGRGVVTFVLSHDEVTNEEVKGQKACSCTFPKQERKKP